MNETVLLHQGFAAHQAGRWQEAYTDYRRVLAINPCHFDALQLSASVCIALGRLPKAIEYFQRALTINDQIPFLHNDLGNVFLTRKEYRQALRCYEKAISLKADYAQAYNNAGLALKGLNRLAEAETSFREAITLAPDFAAAHNNLGDCLQAQAAYPQALVCYEQALALDQGFAGAWNNRGDVLFELGRYDEALASFTRAIDLQPTYAEAYNNQGMALTRLGRYPEAVAAHERAIALDPRSVEAHTNAGFALMELHEFDAARMSFDRALKIDPNYANAHWNKSQLLLLLGEYPQGWKEYEWRWRTAPLAQFKRSFKAPLWLGKQPLHGKTLFIHSEQGYGDVLQFCRYVRLAAAQGAKVILEVPAPLARLLKTLDGVSDIIEVGDTLPAFDLHCPIMSLPLAFNTILETIPSWPTYLQADPVDVAAWAQRLGKKTRPRVGLVWSGRAAQKRNHIRSLLLAELLPWLPDGLEYLCLQKDITAADQALLMQDGRIQCFSEALTDFSETAALIMQLDVVVSVCTSVAHLAGALGKPVWLPLAYLPPDWRWLLGRNDSPWYPSARLYRQQQNRQWATALQPLSEDLRAIDG